MTGDDTAANHDKGIERARSLALIRTANEGSVAGSYPAFELIRAGVVHEVADRACTARDDGEHVHDGAHCYRCRPEVDRHAEHLAAIHNAPDVQAATRELERLEVLVDRAERILGRAVNRAARAYREQLAEARS